MDPQRLKMSPPSKRSRPWRFWTGPSKPTAPSPGPAPMRPSRSGARVAVLRRARPLRFRARYRPGAIAILGALIGALLVGMPVLLYPPQTPTTYPSIPGSLEVGAVSGEVLPGFFGINVHLVGEGSVASGLAGLVNATPFVSFRFAPQGEATDQIHNLTYTPTMDGGIAAYSYNETDLQFVDWCRWITCQATMMVPAEIDNASEAAATVRYVEQALGFRPEYWAIGNEPQEWTHWGIPWIDWRPTDDSSPTPMQYALEVQQYVVAMKAVDPTIRIIGIESVLGGTIESSWFRDLVAIDGANLSAVSYHAYPDGSGSGPGSLAGFFAGLTNPSAFPLNYPATQAIVRSACPSCKIALFVDEFNSALGGSFNSLMTGYAEVPFLTAAFTTALEEGVARVDFFDLEDPTQMPYALATITGQLRPAYELFSDVLDHLVLGTVVNATIEGGPSGSYVALTTNATNGSLLFSETNESYSLALPLPAGLISPSATVSAYSWSPSTSSPTAVPVVSDPLQSPWIVPPQGVLLLTWTTA